MSEKRVFIFVQCHAEETKGTSAQADIIIIEQKLLFADIFWVQYCLKRKGKYHQIVKQNKKIIKTLLVKRTKAILAPQTHRCFYGKVSYAKFKSIPKQEIMKYCVKAPQ